MAKVTLKQKFLKAGVKKYFRTGAEELVLGSYGKKETPALKASYLFQFSKLNIQSGDVKEIGPFEFDFNNTTKADAILNADAKVAEGNVVLTYESLKSGRVVFIQLSLSMLPIIEALNSDSRATDYLKIQEKPRIVNTIFVAVSAEFVERIKGSAGIELNSQKNGVEISLKPSVGGGTILKLVLPKNSTIAYGLAIPVWDGSRTKVVDLNPDLKGAG
ncbi:hypothetical protein C943_01318 [Mariniradius saccharolyticus AK6]|uniref:Uncharacterized protein n=1 Tax=Mariniradius saccharolyticus AK6 TaxID=1239962 RepID=M7Y5Q5_9BACT|nr:hypothetical protein [Mariniradius saccharolyticus]EMS32591.1 hypothetical protein C943_01318 [Mariniradius saccharolyticus AK6]